MKLFKFKLHILLSILLLFTLLSLPGIIYFILKNDILEMIFSWIVPISILLIPLVFFRKLLKWYFIFIGLLTLLAPLALFTILFFGDKLDFEMVALGMHTNIQEASELMLGYLPIIFVSYILYIASIIFLIKNIPRKIDFQKALFISLGAIIMFVSVGFTHHRFIEKTNIKNFVFSYFPFDFIRNIYLVNIYQNQTLKFKNEAQKFAYNNVESPNIKKRQIYILIIGESARYDHWGINGYYRETSPLLKKQKNIISYKNAAAAGAITMYSVPQILTGTNADNFEESRKTGGLLTLFKQAGFRTYYIANQEPISANTFIQSSLADSIVLQTNTTHSTKNVNQDLGLIEVMIEIIEKNEEKTLFILHTSGSHYSYTARYPNSFEKFKPVWNNAFLRPTNKSNKNELVNAYDNSILYTDKIINLSIETLKKTHAISSVIYTSDHGENLFDDERQFVFHAPQKLSKYVGHVPLFIHCNDEYIKSFPSKWNNLNKHKYNKLSNNQIMSTLADIAEITYDEQNLINSLASDEFIDSPQKIVISNNKYKYFFELK